MKKLAVRLHRTPLFGRPRVFLNLNGGTRNQEGNGYRAF